MAFVPQDEKARSQITNFRMHANLEKRFELIKYVSYFAFLGAYVLLSNRRRFEITTIAHSILFSKSSAMISRKFPAEKNLIFNRTSIGGTYEDTADFKIQFSGENVSGSCLFVLNRRDSGKWGWDVADLTYKERDHVPKAESILDLADKNGVAWQEEEKDEKK